jgi:hypothetical protein
LVYLVNEHDAVERTGSDRAVRAAAGREMTLPEISDELLDATRIGFGLDHLATLIP